MNRWCAAVAAVVFATVSVHADVTVRSEMAVQGGPAAAAAPGPMTMVTRIKGMKGRTDVEVGGQPMIMITDVSARTMVLLNPADKTARHFDSTTPLNPNAPMPKLTGTLKATGQTRTIMGIACEEHAMTMTISMAEMLGAKVPPQAAEMLKGTSMAMNGSIWVAPIGPGVEEFVAFTKASAAANMMGVLSGTPPGAATDGLEKLMAMSSQAPGLPYLTEIDMAVEGTGPMVDMMKGSGPMKSTITVTSVTTDPIADDLFTVPADYKVVKQ